MSRAHFAVRVLLGGVALVVTARGAVTAQTANQKPRHPVVCAKGVRIYTDRSQLPVKRDSLTMPPSSGPVRVTSPEEAEAAELALRGRAGSVGATSILVTDETSDDGSGGQRLSRRVAAFFIPADSAQAQQACK